MRSLPWLDTDEINKLRPLVGVAAETVLASNILSGWIFNPDHELAAVQLYLNGEPLAFLPLFERPDVAELYPRFPSALHSGYYLFLPARLIRGDDISRIIAVAYGGDKPLGRTRGIAFREDFLPETPTPPPNLLVRSHGSGDVDTYKSFGYRLYREVLDAVAPHRDRREMRRVLDWGCGSGRVAAHFIRDAQRFGHAVAGCDHHRDSISWCREHLPGGRFDVSPHAPPLGYPDSSFDLIISLGVVYLFTRSELIRWFQELRRVIADRGCLIVSVQGFFAARIRFPVDALNMLARQGVFHSDEYEAQNPTPREKPLFSAGYYWTPEHFKETVSPYFRVIDYLEGGYTVDQDLVVLEPV